MSLTEQDRRYIEQLLTSKIQKIDEQIAEVMHVLRGHNGEPGLVHHVRRNAEKIAELEESDDNRNKRCEDHLNQLNTIRVSMASSAKTISDKPDDSKKAPASFGSWEWFQEKHVVPVITAVVVWVTLEIIKMVAANYTP